MKMRREELQEAKTQRQDKQGGERDVASCGEREEEEEESPLHSFPLEVKETDLIPPLAPFFFVFVGNNLPSVVVAAFSFSLAELGKENSLVSPLYLPPGDPLLQPLSTPLPRMP